MLVPVVHVRHVRMLVAKAGVVVPMRMRLAGGIVCCVRVPVMRIVHMRMNVP